MCKLPGLLLIYLLLGFCTVYAYNDNKDYDLSSPRATIITHLGRLEEGNYNYKVAAKPFLQNDNITEEEAIKYAIFLKEILEEGEVQLDLDKIPVDPNYIDPKAKFHKYQLAESLPKVYLVKVHEKWVYSDATLQYLKKHYSRQYLFGSKTYLTWISKYLYHKTFLKIYGWQMAVLILAIFLAIPLYRFIRFLLYKYCGALAASEGYKEFVSLIRPVNIFIVSVLFRSLVSLLRLPKLSAAKVLIYANGFVFLVMMLLAYHLVDLFAFYIRKQTVDKKISFNLVLLPMVKVGLKVLVIIVGVLVTLQNFGLNIRGLLAGVGIGSLGFALASQDTIKNFFGSLVILTDKPFNIGEYIHLDNLDGKVEEIGFRSTRIRTSQGSRLYVPNGKLADSYINNHGTKQYKQFTADIPIAYTIPIPLIETFIEGLRKIAERCPASREGKYYTYLYDLKKAVFYIKFELNFDVTDHASELQIRHDILLKIMKLAKALDIDFASPTKTLHIQDIDNKNAFVVNSENELADLKERLQAFLNNDNTVT